MKKTHLDEAMYWICDAAERISRSLRDGTKLDRVDLSDSVHFAREHVLKAKARYEPKRRARG
jgi:hypothetical protein